MSSKPVFQQSASGYRWFPFLLVTTLAVMAAMSRVSAPLTTAQAPFGIISYEFSGTIDRARTILESWSHAVKLRAAFSLGLDYLFMPLYAATIGLACRWASEVLSRRRWPFEFLGGWLAGGLWLAAGLDAVENIALTALLFGAFDPFWPITAYICAAVKFGLVFLGMVYAFLGLIVRLVVKPPAAKN